jgi:hypothetical protein
MIQILRSMECGGGAGSRSHYEYEGHRTISVYGGL